jgi:hypothetical protein
MEKEKDVKKEVDPSATNAAPDSADTDKKEESEKVSYEEALGEDKKTIPYAVFKERNDALREAQRKLKKLETDIESKINDAVYKTAQQHRDYYEQEIAKVRAAQQQDQDIYGNENNARYENLITDLKKELTSLKSEVGTFKEQSHNDYLKRQINDFKQIYPNLEVQHVLAMKKFNPDKTLEECAEDSHNHFTSHAKSVFERMVDQKKQAAKKIVVGAEKPFTLKPSERPKTLKEAKQKLAEYLGSSD